MDYISHHFQQGVYTHPGYSLLHILRNIGAQVVRNGLALLKDRVQYRLKNVGLIYEELKDINSTRITEY